MASCRRIVIVPGNGCTGSVADANWYGYARDYLEKLGVASEVVLPEMMPDPVCAKEAVWVPYMLSKLKVDAETILVGHSSGAVAAMRLAEENKVRGVVLVSACWTDLGDEGERAAGYYSRPWLWEKIKGNTQWVLQYHSDNDPFIPVEEARHVAESIGSEYHELQGKSHYFSSDAIEPMLIRLVDKLREEVLL